MKWESSWPWQPNPNGERFLADQYQRVALSLFHMMKERPPAFVFTAAHSRQGTTTAAMGVARQLVQLTDSKPLVVELNRQNPCLAERLSLSSDSGISRFLGGASLEESASDASGVAVLTSGGDWTEDSRIGRLAGRIVENRGGFGPILFDAPALLESADALAIGCVVPQTVVVVRYRQTTEEALSRIRKECANNGMEIVGSILTMREQVVPRWIERWMGRS